MLSEFESIVKSEFTDQGFTVYTSGWPDLLAVRKRTDGSLEIVVREIKGVNDKLHGNQPAILEIFRQLGVDAKVRWESTGEETLGNDPSEYRKVGRPRKAGDRVKVYRTKCGMTKMDLVETLPKNALDWAYGEKFGPKRTSQK